MRYKAINIACIVIYRAHGCGFAKLFVQIRRRLHNYHCNMTNLDIIERISKIRTEANLSARALSQRIELNDGYINRLEFKKDFLPSVDVLLRIIDVCKCSPAKFFYDDMACYDMDMQLLGKLKTLDKETKVLIDNLISRTCLVRPD